LSHSNEETPAQNRITRVLSLSGRGRDDDVQAALKQLAETPGVDKLRFEQGAKAIIITYDQLRLSYVDLVKILQGMSVQAKAGFRSRLRVFWFDYLDTIARENAAAPPAACCNKPPRIPKR